MSLLHNIDESARSSDEDVNTSLRSDRNERAVVERIRYLEHVDLISVVFTSSVENGRLDVRAVRELVGFLGGNEIMERTREGFILDTEEHGTPNRSLVSILCSVQRTPNLLDLHSQFSRGRQNEGSGEVCLSSLAVDRRLKN